MDGTKKMATEIAGNELTGLSDPATMFVAVGIILAIGVVALITWAIYQMFN